MAKGKKHTPEQIVCLLRQSSEGQKPLGQSCPKGFSGEMPKGVAIAPNHLADQLREAP